MEKPKFTPGPWHPGHLGGDSQCQCTSVLSDGYGSGICQVAVDNGIKLISEGGNDGPPVEEAAANMHLIAAAPDMYEAIARKVASDAAIEAHENECQYCICLDGRGCSGAIWAERDAADLALRAALAKADGR